MAALVRRLGDPDPVEIAHALHALDILIVGAERSWNEVAERIAVAPEGRGPSAFYEITSGRDFDPSELYKPR